MCPEQGVQTRMYKGRERKGRKGSPKWKGGCKKWIKLSRRRSNSQMIAAKFVRLLSLFDQMFPNIRGETKSRRIFKKPSLNHGKNISWHSPEALEGNFRTKLLFSFPPQKRKKKREEFRHLLFLLSSINHGKGRRWQIYPPHLPHPPPVPLIGNRVAKNKDQSSLVIKYLSRLLSNPVLPLLQAGGGEEKNRYVDSIGPQVQIFASARYKSGISPRC